MNLFLRILQIFILLFAMTSCKKSKPEIPTPAPVTKYAHTSGSLILDGNNEPLKLQGVAFGNFIWSDELPLTHHSETDFQRLNDLNMNVVRFYLNYKTFENDAAPYTYKQSGWDWIDTNVAWAKKHKVYLLLNMHAPQGGYQSQGKGDALWNDIENQNRLTALWKAIADRYKNEPFVIGYGLVNEPVPVKSLAQWQLLSQRITNSIREVDKNHIVFVEKPIWIKNVAVENADYNFPPITDNNIVYEFHIYDPIQYTHQLFTWANMGEGGKYPDESIITVTGSTWYTATFDNPKINAGTNNWKYFEGVKYVINDSKIKVGYPALVGRNVQGKVLFDDIVIKEFDTQGNFTGNIVSMNLNSMDGWYYWSENNSGMAGLSLQTGNTDGASIYISGATGDCNVSNSNKLFIPKQGYAYQICGWMKGENVATDAACMLRIDFSTTNDPIYTRNKLLMQAVMNKYINWSKQKNVPVYMGEFGAGIHCFDNDKGGLQWVSDMIDICQNNNVYFTYHAYHEDSFGLYLGYTTLPNASNANTPLINLFTEKLK